jgi:hypothetical protein
MNRKATLALYAQGCEAWNAWAEKLLAKRHAIEAAGNWCVEESLYITPGNEARRYHLKKPDDIRKGISLPSRSRSRRQTKLSC